MLLFASVSLTFFWRVLHISFSARLDFTSCLEAFLPLCHSLFWLTVKVLVLYIGRSSSCSVSRLSVVSKQLYLSTLLPGSEPTVGFSQHLLSLGGWKWERMLRRLESKDCQTPDFDVVLDSRCGLVVPTGQLVANEVSHLCADLPAARHFFFRSQNTMQSGSLPST